MGITKKQHRAISFKAPIGIMYDAFAGSQANLIKVLSTIDACGICITFYLEYIKSL